MVRALDEVRADMAATYDDLRAGRITAGQARQKAKEAEQAIKLHRAELRRMKAAEPSLTGR